MAVVTKLIKYFNDTLQNVVVVLLRCIENNDVIYLYNKSTTCQIETILIRFRYKRIIGGLMVNETTISRLTY